MILEGGDLAYGKTQTWEVHQAYFCGIQGLENCANLTSFRVVSHDNVVPEIYLNIVTLTDESTNNVLPWFYNTIVQDKF